MALVTSFEETRKDRTTVHRQPRCFYSIVEGGGYHRYLQLDTVGSDERQITDKISQSMQFDRAAASQLMQLLKQAFPGIGD